MEKTKATCSFGNDEYGLQTGKVKISEKAFAYKMKLEAMKSQGKRNDLTLSQLGTKLNKEETAEGKKILRTDERLAKEVGRAGTRLHDISILILVL